MKYNQFVTRKCPNFKKGIGRTIEIYNAKFGCSIQWMKPLQEKAVAILLEGKSDVICMLPIGYGKSLIYEIIPFAQSTLKNEPGAFIFVIEPLNVIIQQQVNKLNPDAVNIKENMGAEEKDKLRSGSYTYIFSHPEYIIGNKEMYTIFLNDVYQSKPCFIVVDEAHCVLNWGADYRPMFREIKQLRAVLPCANVLALSATLSLDGQREIGKHLLMQNQRVVSTSPTRANISLTVMRRPPLSTLFTSKKTYDCVFEPVFNQLKMLGQDFPLTVIYCSGSMDWVGYGFEVASKVLGASLFTCDQIPENQRVMMFHSSIEQGNQLKEIIFRNLSRDPKESLLKVVLATVALGMGADLRHVRTVVHAGPPKNMEAYIQQIGRAGRSGEQSTAVLFINNSDVGRPDVAKTIKLYCANDDTCRRSLINGYFGFKTDEEKLPLCCDICRPDLKTSWIFPPPLDEMKKHTLRNAINAYFKSLNIEEGISSHSVGKIVSNAHFYTSQQALMKDFTFSDSLSTTLSSIIKQLLDQMK